MAYESKVIGYFAYFNSDNKVVCDGDSCVIAGSEDNMLSYLLNTYSKNEIKRDVIIKKTRFGEVYQGLMAKGAYSFDREAYERFFAVASKINIDIPDPSEFDLYKTDSKMHFLKIFFHEF